MTRRLSSRIREIFVLFILALGSVLVSAATTENVLYNFQPRLHGQQPSGGLIADAAGNLYGATFWGGSYGLGTVFELTLSGHGGWSEIVLYNFTGGNDVYAPNGSLVFDAAGNLYGAGLGGGANAVGGVFRLKPSSGGSWTETVLYSFPLRGGWPNGGWVFDQSGNLYGTTLVEGGNTVYELSPGPDDQWTASVIYQFTSAELNGNLIVDKAGNLYGTAIQVGSNNGEVFELSPSSGGSWTETVLYKFRGAPDAEFPGGGVIADAAGNLYGVAINGGNGTGCDGGPCGAVYELIRGANNSWMEKGLYSFQGGTDGRNPYGVLSFDKNGNLYGTSYYGGTADYGTVFELVRSAGRWTETILWNYSGGSDGGNPDFGVTLGASGQIYVTASVGAGLLGNYDGNASVLQLIPSDGKVNETIVTRFPLTDGAAPETDLIADSAGNFYGTTSIGGAYNYGTVFELTRSSGGVWTDQVLYSFKSGLDFNQGASPSPLIFDSHGNLFGETAYDGQSGRGTVFELSPAGGGKWTVKELYTFTGGADGGQPYGGLVFDSEGNLYGTTEYGGKSSACGVLECGTVFKLTQSSGSWSQSVLYNFTGGATDGANPAAGLVFDQNGNLYGTTRYGADLATCAKGCGVVFELSPASGAWTERLLYAFTNSNHDGREPAANLIFDSLGNLYGTTAGGGTDHVTCCGTVFELSPGTGGAWNEKVLLYFPANKSQGAYPSGKLSFDGSGNLYGVTPLGGQNLAGTVYELSPASGGVWNEIVLYSFTASLNERGGASYPVGGLLLDSSGNLYGTAGAGQSGSGAVFEITP